MSAVEGTAAVRYVVFPTVFPTMLLFTWLRCIRNHRCILFAFSYLAGLQLASATTIANSYFHPTNGEAVAHDESIIRSTLFHMYVVVVHRAVMNDRILFP